MPPARTVADAADAFLARATATTTRRSYGQTMNALTKTYDDRPLEALDGPGERGTIDVATITIWLREPTTNHPRDAT